MTPPREIVPFTIYDAQVRELVGQWAASEPLAPSDFRRAPPIVAVSAVYVPFWMFGAKVRCWWQAEVGYYTDQDWASQKPDERIIDWGRTMKGEVEETFGDVLVPAATGVLPDLDAIEPWPVQHLVPADEAHISGPVIEPAQVSQADATTAARTIMERVLRNACELAVPGDTCRGLEISPDYSAETSRLVLLPVWRVDCLYRGKVFQVLVNGATGKMKGTSPTSGLKFAGALLVVLGLMLVALAIGYVIGQVLRP